MYETLVQCEAHVWEKIEWGEILVEISNNSRDAGSMWISGSGKWWIQGLTDEFGMCDDLSMWNLFVLIVLGSVEAK